MKNGKAKARGKQPGNANKISQRKNLAMKGQGRGKRKPKGY